MQKFGQISKYLTPVRIMAGVGEITESEPSSIIVDQGETVYFSFMYSRCDLSTGIIYTNIWIWIWMETITALNTDKFLRFETTMRKRHRQLRLNFALFDLL